MFDFARHRARWLEGSRRLLEPSLAAAVLADPSGKSLSLSGTLGTRDITGRMEDTLGRHGFGVGVMKADAVPPERGKAWVAKRVEEGVDVLVCHPRLVQAGLR